MKPHKWVFYKDRNKNWRWKRKAGNGRVVEAASEGYKNLVDAKKNAKLAGWTPDAITKIA